MADQEEDISLGCLLESMPLNCCWMYSGTQHMLESEVRLRCFHGQSRCHDRSWVHKHAPYEPRVQRSQWYSPKHIIGMHDNDVHTTLALRGLTDSGTYHLIGPGHVAALQHLLPVGVLLLQILPVALLYAAQAADVSVCGSLFL